jgi:hypothetical protein
MSIGARLAGLADIIQRRQPAVERIAPAPRRTPLSA